MTALEVLSCCRIRKSVGGGGGGVEEFSYSFKLLVSDLKF